LIFFDCRQARVFSSLLFGKIATAQDPLACFRHQLLKFVEDSREQRLDAQLTIFASRIKLIF
jgi:hypothetical protein